MLESDSDIEIVSAPPPPTAPTHSRPLFLPTSSASDPKRQHPRPPPPIASTSFFSPPKASVKPTYTAGAWASSPTRGGSSSAAAQADPAPLPKERRPRDETEAGRREPADTQQEARDGPASAPKGKGRASEMIMLSSGSDDEQLVVVRHG